MPAEQQTDDLFLTALVTWRLHYKRNPLAASFPPLPPEKADKWARAIGVRFNGKTGKMRLVAPDIDFFAERGIKLPKELTRHLPGHLKGHALG